MRPQIRTRTSVVGVDQGAFRLGRGADAVPAEHLIVAWLQPVRNLGVNWRLRAARIERICIYSSEYRALASVVHETCGVTFELVTWNYQRRDAGAGVSSDSDSARKSSFPATSKGKSEDNEWP
jgi:hypothetical protein